MAEKIMTKTPRSISHWMLFLKWEMDELAIFFTPFVLSFPSRQLIVGLVIGFLLMYYYSKLKYSKPAGFIIHWLMKKGIIQPKQFPPTHASVFFK